MGEMLSQEEIQALLMGGQTDTDDDGNDELMAEIDEFLSEGSEEAASNETASGDDYDSYLSSNDRDVLGEVGNISMGTAATTLFTLLKNKVLITTPKVNITNWKTLSSSYDRPCVGVKVSYTEGLTGTNILILKEHDVKIIASLMMGGDGTDVEDGDITDLEVSAVSEAMNQMVGSSSTSLSSVIKRKIDIDTPESMILNFGDEDFFDGTGFAADDILACVSFRMEVGDLIDSEITQIIPIDFAKDIVNTMMGDLISGSEEQVETAVSTPAAPQPAAAADTQPAAQPASAPPAGAPAPQATQHAVPPQGQHAADPRQPVVYPHQTVAPNISAQPTTFEALDFTELTQQKENIGIIMDVPLEVTVELGRTTRKIKEILEFAPGTVVDLDKLAGEPIDILVNGKFVASGEVVVVDENFAVRVTDIVNVDKRI